MQRQVVDREDSMPLVVSRGDIRFDHVSFHYGQAIGAGTVVLSGADAGNYVLVQPSGSRPEMRDLFYQNNMKGWGPELVKRRPDDTSLRKLFCIADTPY